MALQALLYGTSLFSGTVDADAAFVDPDKPIDEFSKLVAWMKTNGGRVDERIAVMQVDGIRGGVALADIQKGAELLHCPWELVIGSNSLQDQMKDMCGVVRSIEAELQLGETSLWHPYLELDDSLVNSRLPTLWDATALDELQGLAPQDSTRHIQWFSQYCDGGRPFQEVDEVTKQALLSFITRASAVGMIPIYDLLNHHNGKKNAKIALTESGVQLMAFEAISSGEQIYISYGIKSASTMYRDYGFVESWPQTWTWVEESSSDRYSFVLFPDDIVVINPTAVFLKSIWSTHMPLRDFQDRAMQHTQTLPPEDLRRFGAAAYKLMDGLPTSVDEDTVILAGMKESLLAMNSNDKNEAQSKIKDAISAVEYRITFKQAIQIALTVSQATLLGSTGNGSGQEL